MEKEQMDALLLKVNEKVKSGVAEAVKTEITSHVQGLVTAEKMTATLEEMGLKKEFIDEIKTTIEAVATQGLKINELAGGKGTSAGKSIAEQIKSQGEELKKFGETAKSGSKLNVTINLKNHLAAQKGTIIDTNWGSNNVGMVVPEINNDPFRLPVFRNEIPKIAVSPDSRGVIFYTEQDTVTRGAAARTTGQQAGASTLTFISRSASLTNVTDSIKIARETMTDWSTLGREVQKFIELNLGLIEDEYLWDGTGVAPILKGLYTYGTTYVASGVKYGTKAYLYDLIADMRLQVETGYNGKYQATHVCLNNQDAQAMWSTKNADGDYIVPWFVDPKAKTIYGMKVIESSIIDKGTCLVGDLRQAALYVDEEMELEFGLDGEDFSKRLVTLMGNIREYLLVKNIDALALVVCADTAAAIPALQESVA